MTLSKEEEKQKKIKEDILSLKESVEAAAAHCAVLSDHVENYFDDTEPKLLNGINSLVSQLQQLDQLARAESLERETVPFQLLLTLDANASPDAFTAARVKHAEAALNDNKGKQAAIKQAKEILDKLQRQ